MKNLLICLFIALAGVSCSTSSSVTSNSTNQNESKLSALLWQQTSAEYEALCIQAYNLAKKSLDHANNSFLDGSKPPVDSNKPLSIIMDIDETVLDNSPYQASLILNGQTFNESSWTEWINTESAQSIPGATEFIEYAQEKNIKIYYISNRSIEHKEATVSNLQKLGINAQPDDLLLKQEGLSKAERRNRVDGASTILLLIGDNLADFDDSFENDLTIQERKSISNSEFIQEYGERFIIIPNVTYGDWEKALKNRKSDIFQDNPNMGAERFLKSY